MTDPQLSLLTIHQRRPVSEREKGREIVKRMGERNSRVLQEIRDYLRWQFDQDGEPKSSDDGWAYLDRCPELRLSHPNAMGALFAGAQDWKPVGWTRSERKGSHSNLLRLWAPIQRRQ